MKKKLKSTRKYKTGTKVNYLTILEIIGKGVNRKVICKCDCGTVKEFYLANIQPRKGKSRYTKSCGCQTSNMVSEKIRTHGLSATKFYKRWRSMFDRIAEKYICAENYKDIWVCDRWKKFENFHKDMWVLYLEHKEKWGERQTTLDRINPFKGYSPENCRWATFSVQSKNTKKNYIKLGLPIKDRILYKIK